ncbi:DUF975 family protein [Streptococcus uberis]|uniref:DUF975 family protein n=1 Tax=Streptococcus uberis TaxID=1349 RepID=UPI0012B52A38|nr:DUF975 family protein [Streptococcus uberis]MTB58501.1 DUF975 family protein [Streptococcus uberis]
MKQSQLKKQAKHLLKHLPGKYQLFAIPIALHIILLFIQLHQNYLVEQGISISTFASIFPILLNMLASFFLLSAAFTILKVIRQQKKQVTFSDSSLVFNNPLFRKLTILLSLKFLLIFLWSLILMLGLGLLGIGYLFYSINLKTGSPIMAPISVMILGGLVALIGLIIAINRQLAYSMSENLLFDQIEKGEDPAAIDIIDHSISLMKGYKWKFFLFQFSFIGWFLLAILSFGILYIYLLPYVTTSILYFYDFIKDSKDKSLLDDKKLNLKN